MNTSKPEMTKEEILNKIAAYRTTRRKYSDRIIRDMTISLSPEIADVEEVDVFEFPYKDQRLGLVGLSPQGDGILIATVRDAQQWKLHKFMQTMGYRFNRNLETYLHSTPTF